MSSWKTFNNQLSPIKSHLKSKKIPSIPLVSQSLDHHSQLVDKIKEVLKKSFANIEEETVSLVVSRFGLNGESPLSQSELANRTGLDIKTVQKLETEALRAMMGYGKVKKNIKEKSITH
jgi:DNA-directed RNA polymerase sigma subunit (sigma70/sigma32)